MCWLATRKQWTPTLDTVVAARSARGLAGPDAYRDAAHLRRPFADQDRPDRAVVQDRATTVPGAGEPVCAAVVSVWLCALTFGERLALLAGVPAPGHHVQAAG